MTTNRTRFDTEFDIRYAMRCARLHAQFFGRIDLFLMFFQAVAMASAIYAIYASTPAAASIIGVLVAIAFIIQLVADLRGRAAKENVIHDEYVGLLASITSMSDEEAERALRQQYRGVTDEIQSLRYVAYNDVIDELGLDPAAKYDKAEINRLVAFIAGGG